VIKLNNIENAILHVADISSSLKNFIHQEWDEKLTDNQKFDVMIQAVKMQNDICHKGKN